jgi:hypothetical protein
MTKREEHPELDPIYTDVMIELHRKLRDQFEKGSLLEQLLDGEHYGHYKSFAELVKHELQIAERTAFRLVFASRMMERLRKAKCPVLPTHESQVRPLSRLPEEEWELRIDCWRTACHLKQDGGIPTAADVTRAVLQVLKAKPSRHSADIIREYRQQLTRAQGALTKGLEIMLDSDFQNFLAADGHEKVETAGRKTKVETIRDRISRELVLLSETIDQHSENFEMA